MKGINFDLSEINFPLFVLQMRYHIFPLRNRNQRQNYSGHQTTDYMQDQVKKQDHTGYEEIPDDDYELHQEFQRQLYESHNKIFFILRDRFLLTKVQITGTVVFYIRKEEKYFFGIDDSTGVMTCVLWLNDYNKQNLSQKKNQDFRNWFQNQQIQIGSCVSVLGLLEYFKDKIQVNVQKVRAVADINDEMLQYQLTVNAQKCFFDPFAPFQRRLFGN